MRCIGEERRATEGPGPVDEARCDIRGGHLAEQPAGDEAVAAVASTLPPPACAVRTRYGGANANA